MQGSISQGISFHLVDVMNDFGKNGGFDALLERLSNHKPNMKVKHLRFILPAISKVEYFVSFFFFFLLVCILLSVYLNCYVVFVLVVLILVFQNVHQEVCRQDLD